MGEAEGDSAGEEHGPTRTEKPLIAMKEESAVEQLLWKNGEERIEQHEERPEARGALHESEEEFWGEESDGQAEKKEK